MAEWKEVDEARRALSVGVRMAWAQLILARLQQLPGVELAAALWKVGFRSPEELAGVFAERFSWDVVVMCSEALGLEPSDIIVGQTAAAANN